MRNGQGRLPILLISLILLSFLRAASPLLGQETAPPLKAQETQAKAQPEKIVAAPQNIKESSRLYVFLGWMWLAIAILVYFLRLKIKEADRLYDLTFFLQDKK